MTRAGARMAAEMAEQPAALAALVARRAEIAALVADVRPSFLSGVVLLARGSSDHAATFGRYLLEPAAGRPVAAAAPSLHTLYGADVDHRGVLVVAVSQSGRTPEIATVLERLGAAGARTLAVVNDAGSPVAEAAGGALALGVGVERAVPATKTFTAQALALALVAEALGGAPVDWSGLPGAVAAVLDDEAAAERTAAAIGGAGGLIAVGRGCCYAVALEAALKLQETAELLAHGFSTADLRHGPAAAVVPGLPVLALSAGGPAEADTLGLVEELHGRGAAVHEVAPRPNADLPLPEGLPEPAGAIAAAVRAQQVALALARRRGLDPDAPRGLAKVTATR